MPRYHKRAIMEAMNLAMNNDKECIHPSLMKQIKERKTSLGDHPIFPEGDETNFEEKIMRERYNEVLANYKKQFDVDKVTIADVIQQNMDTGIRTMEMEDGNEEVLIDLAVKLIREEFDVEEDEIEFECILNKPVNMDSLKDMIRPRPVDIEFESHQEIESANKEVYKRRFINAMVQGSAKKFSHLYHMAEKELDEINPRLTGAYSKLIAASDYTYLSMPDTMAKIKGGLCTVEYPKSEDEPTKVTVQALTFPILLHELSKGVMEVLSSHGLPEEDHILEFTLAKADFLAAEAWDMRMGVKLWEYFLDAINDNYLEYRYYIFAAFIALPVDEFNEKMREIISKTKRGKEVLQEVSEDVKNRVDKERLNLKLIANDFGDNEFFEPGDLDKFDIGYFEDDDIEDIDEE
jgi:hypothetical protein